MHPFHLTKLLGYGIPTDMAPEIKERLGMCSRCHNPVVVEMTFGKNICKVLEIKCAVCMDNLVITSEEAVLYPLYNPMDEVQSTSTSMSELVLSKENKEVLQTLQEQRVVVEVQCTMGIMNKNDKKTIIVKPKHKCQLTCEEAVEQSIEYTTHLGRNCRNRDLHHSVIWAEVRREKVGKCLEVEEIGKEEERMEETPECGEIDEEEERKSEDYEMEEVEDSNGRMSTSSYEHEEDLEREQKETEESESEEEDEDSNGSESSSNYCPRTPCAEEDEQQHTSSTVQRTTHEEVGIRSVVISSDSDESSSPTPLEHISEEQVDKDDPILPSACSVVDLSSDSSSHDEVVVVRPSPSSSSSQHPSNRLPLLPTPQPDEYGRIFEYEGPLAGLFYKVNNPKKPLIQIWKRDKYFAGVEEIIKIMKDRDCTKLDALKLWEREQQQKEKEELERNAKLILRVMKMSEETLQEEMKKLERSSEFRKKKFIDIKEDIEKIKSGRGEPTDEFTFIGELAIVDICKRVWFRDRFGVEHQTWRMEQRMRISEIEKDKKVEVEKAVECWEKVMKEEEERRLRYQESLERKKKSFDKPDIPSSSRSKMDIAGEQETAHKGTYYELTLNKNGREKIWFKHPENDHKWRSVQFRRYYSLKRQGMTAVEAAKRWEKELLEEEKKEKREKEDFLGRKRLRDLMELGGMTEEKAREKIEQERIVRDQMIELRRREVNGSKITFPPN